MRLGFTGTRDGMSITQFDTFHQLVTQKLLIDSEHEWHAGDCLGADEQSTLLVQKLKRDWARVETHGHPCNLRQYRAHLDYDVTHPIYPPLTRNKHIVLSSDIIFCAPREYEEVHRGSGTWATIRYARRLNRLHYLIWPDGECEIVLPKRSVLDQ